MISANDLRKKRITSAANGYTIDEINHTFEEAANTIDAYANENKELYHKMEVLAAKIEEYREEENSIKAALITAQKMAQTIEKESSDKAQSLLADSEEKSQKTVDDANAKADKIVSEAREYASALLKEKTDEANALVEDAEKKANDAINSSKIVAQNILDQAKEISEDLIAKSKEEKEAYELLISALKNDAASFIANLKDLYSAQLDALNSAKLESTEESAETAEVTSIHQEVDSLVSEIGEMENAIPDEISIDKPVYEAPAEEDDGEEEDDFEVIDEPEEKETEITGEEETFAVADAPEEEDAVDTMQAVEAFSQDEITPIDPDARIIPEIDEEPQMETAEGSLFDDDKLPFETYFNIKTDDAHGDKSQTISLVPDEEPDEDDEPKFKGFFKKKK